jgi:hypothetical protein
MWRQQGNSPYALFLLFLAAIVRDTKREKRQSNPCENHLWSTTKSNCAYGIAITGSTDSYFVTSFVEINPNPDFH